MGIYEELQERGLLAQVTDANEIRALENMNKIPADQGGDLYLLNGNMISAMDAGTGSVNNEKKEVNDDQTTDG